MIHFIADYISRFVRVLQMQGSRKSGRIRYSSRLHFPIRACSPSAEVKQIYSEYAATVENTKQAHGPWPLALGPYHEAPKERRDKNGALGKIARVLRSPHKHLTALPDHPYEALLQSTLPCNNDPRPLVSN